MKTYFKCSICGKFEEVNRANFTADDEQEKNPMCKPCFYNHQDNLAYEMSDGEFINYEDWMESRGATICDSYYPENRGCYGEE